MLKLLPGTTLTCATTCADVNNSASFLAKRIPPRPLPKPTTLQQKQGLRYEKNVVKALRARGFDLEHNPWFEHTHGVCCPDIIVYELSQNRAIVIEVKLTFVPEALDKLRTLYCPIVAEVTGLRALPAIIFKNGNASGIAFQPSFWQMLDTPSPIYLWPGHGPII